MGHVQNRDAMLKAVRDWNGASEDSNSLGSGAIFVVPHSHYYFQYSFEFTPSRHGDPALNDVEARLYFCISLC